MDGQTLPFTREVLFQHICLPMIWIVVLMVIGRFLWRVCFFGSAVSVAADLRERMFDHSRRLSQQYYQVNKVGNLMSLYTNDLDTIQECFGDGILMFFDAAVLGIMALVKMWRMDCKLTLLALIPAAVMFVLGTVMSQVMTRRWEERQQAFSDLSDFAQENFSGIAVIKAFVKEFKELIAFRRLNKENEEVNVAYTKIATLLEVLVTLFVESVICVILGYGGWLVWRGQFNAGQLVEYIGYFEAIVWPIMAISMLIEKTSRGKASLNRITELLDAPIDVADRDGVADLRDPHGGIEFRHLTFRYPRRRVRRAEGRIVHHQARRKRRHRRQDRRRQDRAGGPFAADLQCARRHAVCGRAGRERRVHPFGARSLRLRAAGQLPVLGHDCPQHRLRRGRRQPGRH